MGWYVTCTSCGLEEKYSHPSCDCLKNERESICAKIIDATVVNSIIRNGEHLDDSIMYTHYRKGSDDFYIGTVLVQPTGGGEYTINHSIFEITEQDFKTI